MKVIIKRSIWAITASVLAKVATAAPNPQQVIPPSPAEPMRASSASSIEFKSLSEFVDGNLGKWDAPGVAIAIVRNGDVVYAQGFGLRDVARKLPVTPDTLFGIGSCTKAFTSFVLGTLVDEGKLNWNAPLRTYLPAFEMHDPTATLSLNTVDLMAHRSGLPTDPLLGYNNTALSRSELVARLRFLEPRAELRQAWQYSNLMYDAAGYLVDVLAGEPWESVVRKRILTPLGMSRSNLSVRDLQTDSDSARPYLKDKHSLRELPYLDLGIDGPAGGLNSSVNEMARWLIVNLHQGRYADVQLIQPATLRQIHTPQMVLPMLPTQKNDSPASYAMGWLVRNPRGRLLLHHGGGTFGFTAEVLLFPLDDVGIVVLANSAMSPVPSILALRAMDLMFGEVRQDGNAETLAQDNERPAAVGNGERTNRSYDKGALKPSHALAAYAGEYSHPAHGLLRIEKHGSQLRAIYNTFRNSPEQWHYDSLAHADHDTFVGGDSLLHPQLKGMKYQFGLDLNGRVAYLNVHLPMQSAPVTFARY